MEYVDEYVMQPVADMVSSEWPPLSYVSGSKHHFFATKLKFKKYILSDFWPT